MARVLSKIPVGKIEPLRVSQRKKLSQQRHDREMARRAANVAQYEKEKAARGATGYSYSQHLMKGSNSTSNYNPRTRTFEEFMSIAEAVSASDRKLAASGILSKRADDLQREIDAVQSGKKPEEPKSNKSGKRIPTKQNYEVKEEYQLIIDYLIEEGYAQNIEEAENIYLNLDEGLLGDVGKLAWKGTKAALRAVRNYGEKYPVGSKRRAVADVLSHIRSATLSDAEKRKRANAKHRARNTKKGHEEIMAKNRESQEISDRWHEQQRKKQERRRAQTGKYRGLGVGSKESVREETEVADKPATPEERRKIALIQKLAKLKAAAKAPAIVSDVATKEEYEIDEAKVDEKLPDYKRSAARLARYDNPSGALALGGGQQRARRAEHEQRRGVKKSKS